MARKKPQTEYVVSFSITGRATAIVTASSADEARAKARSMDVENGQLIEWEFDEWDGDLEVNE